VRRLVDDPLTRAGYRKKPAGIVIQLRASVRQISPELFPSTGSGSRFSGHNIC
jgi:hypothetical protein